jgi:hypothetical protein
MVKRAGSALGATEAEDGVYCFVATTASAT